MTPVVPIPAVSVIPLRDGPGGLEVFVQHRVTTMDFAAGAVVFPGGRIDPIDRRCPAAIPAAQLEEFTRLLSDSTYVAAAEDPHLAVRTVVAAALRELAEEADVRLDPCELVPWDDWTTPPGYPKRFQVHFFAAHLPAADPRSPRNTTTEALASEWLSVSELLDRGECGELALMRPTHVILRELADLASAAAVLAACPEIVPVHNDQTGPRPRPPRRAEPA